MSEKKTERNKTIDISVGEGQQYLARCLSIHEKAALADILDRTICGDCLTVMPLLPEGFIDLLIAEIGRAHV